MATIASGEAVKAPGWSPAWDELRQDCRPGAGVGRGSCGGSRRGTLLPAPLAKGNRRECRTSQAHPETGSGYCPTPFPLAGLPPGLGLRSWSAGLTRLQPDSPDALRWVPPCLSTRAPLQGFVPSSSGPGGRILYLWTEEVLELVAGGWVNTVVGSLRPHLVRVMSAQRERPLSTRETYEAVAMT